MRVICPIRIFDTDGPLSDALLQVNDKVYINSKCHKLDGPAIIDNKGNKYYYISGKQYTREEHLEHPLVIEAITKKIYG